jgi:branched-chain amino acid transport system ATP-binding protein
VTAAARLRLDQVSVPRAGRPVLREVSLEIAPGQVTALLGPNGAGKSTLVLTVAGLLRPTAGRILLVGGADKSRLSSPAEPPSRSSDAVSPGLRPPAQPSERELTGRRPEWIRRAGVAIVAEGRRVLPDLSVADNLRVATYGLERGQADQGMDRALELFPELKRRWDTGARLLSGGEQQMVVLAQALVSQPAVLIVDELSLGLAPVVVKRLVPTLAAVAEAGVGVLLIEQFAHVALGLADNAFILEGGRIRYQGTAGELKANPELLHSAYLLRV